MNRKARRATLKGDRRPTAASAGAIPDIAALLADAGQAYQQGDFARARDLCRQVLAREPSHPRANNLIGVVFQALKRDSVAIGHFRKALAVDDAMALYHYNIGFSYQRLKAWDEAVRHFTRAIALRMDGRPIEDFVVQYPAVAGCLARIAQQWPRRLTIEALFGDAGIAIFAEDAFLRCALEKAELADLEVETLLISIRFALLQFAYRSAPACASFDDQTLGFFAALAQQCFISEYLLEQGADETRQVEELAALLIERATAGPAIPPLLLITVATYMPLHRLPVAAALLNLAWPPLLAGLVRQQLAEPAEEIQLRGTIAMLTPVDNDVSIQVQRQYEQSPYPRWTTVPDITVLSDWRTRFDAPEDPHPSDVLIAGCGTGQNPIQAAQKFPQSRIVAVDLSASSLAYAIRKTREAGIVNIEYAQADILEMGSISRSFDRIEVVGVLHHLADPLAGWRVLTSLLRQGGVMDVGLYSELARKPVVTARALIAERDYPATASGIRSFRRDVRLANPGLARSLMASPDFYTTSGCHDLLFHVMEHRFTIPRVAEFLAANDLTFLGFRLGTDAMEKFRADFPDAEADLGAWHAFEQANPHTFAAMYRFAVRKILRPGCVTPFSGASKNRTGPTEAS